MKLQDEKLKKNSDEIEATKIGKKDSTYQAVAKLMPPGYDITLIK